MELSENSIAKPLVVDLDGTLLKSDVLWECLFVFFRTMPWHFYLPFFWLFRGGKSYLKTRLTEHVTIPIEYLPFDKVIVNWLIAAKAAGRKIILATATHEKFANDISNHLGLFDEVHATDINCNLSGQKKRNLLIKKYGKKGYDYVGNSWDDLLVWQTAANAYLVNPPVQVEKRALRINNIKEIFKTNAVSWRTWLKALRLHQWLKNFLIFIPLLASHQLSVGLFAKGLVAFIIFGICASSVYLLNDLLDLNDDRRHVSKKNRAFASGAIAIQLALVLVPLLFFMAFVSALLLLPLNFVLILLLYYLITLGYSLSFKRIIMFDVVVLAGLYTLRIVSGLVVFSLEPTFWMLAFAMFIFMSLALVKRYAELIQIRNTDKLMVHGRGYYHTDLEMIASLGAASGYLSVLILALYIQDQTTTLLYQFPKILWVSCPLLLFWISRTWLLTHRGMMHDDPIIFAMKDKLSLMIGFLFMFIFWLAT